MGTSRKKLVLAYSPYTTATAPPLGVCSIKGFVERNLPEWSVKVLDLNLLAHQRVFSELNHRICPQDIQQPEELVTQVLLSRAAETFAGQRNDEFYGRPDRCLLYANAWNRNVRTLVGNFHPQENGLRQDAPTPAQVGWCVDRILEEQPDIIGLSICYNEQLLMSLCLATELKKRTDVPIIAGGTFFNSLDEEFLAGNAGILDYVITGEGEKPLAAFLAGQIAPDQVPGIISFKDGKAVSNPPAFEENLDSLGEPDFSDLDLHAYYSPLPVIPITTSRGCYWRRCAFCAHYKSAGLTYRLRTIPNVIEELRRHHAIGIRHFSVIDEMISPACFSQLADAILESGLKFHYYAMAKPTRQFDRELLGRMHRSGCQYILWGLESGSQRILDLMNKGTRVDEIEEVLETAREVGLRNHVFVMFGFPTETRQEFQLTLDLLSRHKAAISHVHRGLFQLEKNSPVFDDPARYSISRLSPSPTPGLYHFECSVGMSRREVQDAFAKSILFLRGFSSDWPVLGDFWSRDHLLLIYSRAALDSSAST